MAKFGVPPDSIPDYLGLVGDSADGFPGLPGWGAKSAAAVLARYGHLETIPDDWREWQVKVASPAKLSASLTADRDRAILFRTLATLRSDIPLFDSVDQLHWAGPTPHFAALAERLDGATRGTRLAALLPNPTA
jgi:5'-3' exonuclease